VLIHNITQKERNALGVKLDIEYRNADTFGRDKHDDYHSVGVYGEKLPPFTQVDL
jgi:hypothetical protein